MEPRNSWKVDLAAQFTEQFKISQACVSTNYKEDAKKRYDGESLPIYFARFNPMCAMLFTIIMVSTAAFISGLIYKYVESWRPIVQYVAVLLVVVSDAAVIIIQVLNIRSTRHQRYEGKWQQVVDDMFKRCAALNVSKADLKRGLKIKIYSLEQTWRFLAASVGALALYVNMESRLFNGDTSHLLSLFKKANIPAAYTHIAFTTVFILLLFAILLFAYGPLEWHRNIEVVMDQLDDTDDPK